MNDSIVPGVVYIHVGNEIADCQPKRPPVPYSAATP